jgi:NADH-quinone oxidoreductase subunit L
VIHATHRQEVGELGGLWRKMPITNWTFLIGALAMAGLIPLSGFWAKDEILHALRHDSHPVVFGLVLASLVVTALYMGRLYILTFTGKPKDHHVYEHAHESGFVMAFPLVLLAALTLVGGFVVYDQVGEGLGFVGGIGKFFESEFEGFHFDTGLALTSIALVTFGLFLSWFFYWGDNVRRAEAAGRAAPDLYQLLNNRYYMDSLYQAIIDRVFLGAGRAVAWFDRQVVNDTGVDGTAALTRYAGYLLKFTQTGKIPNYALGIMIGAVGLAILALTTQL